IQTSAGSQEPSTSGLCDTFSSFVSPKRYQSASPRVSLKHSPSTSPSSSSMAFNGSTARNIPSPPSPSFTLGVDYSFDKEYHQNLGLQRTYAVRQLEFLTKALTHQALGLTSQPDNGGGSLLPFGLQSFGSSSSHYTQPYVDVKPFQIYEDSAYFPEDSKSTKKTNGNGSGTQSTKSTGGPVGSGTGSSNTTNSGGLGLVYTCQRCGKAYGVRRSLHRHQKFECGVEPKFVCPVCNKRCTHKFNLKQHILSHHKQIANVQ
ncbi:hypothetical protein SK128_026200, partial [Halocaridina rubra]